MAVFSSTHDYSLHPRLLLRHSTGACALRGIHSLEGMHSPVTPASIELKFAGGILGIIDIPAMGLTQGGTPCANEKVHEITRLHHGLDVNPGGGGTDPRKVRVGSPGAKQMKLYLYNFTKKGGLKNARERVQFRKPRWHTRVQKLSKSPPPGCKQYH